MTTVQHPNFLKNGISSFRCSLRLITGCPVSSTAWIWKVDLAVSRLIMVMLIVDGSPVCGSHAPHHGTSTPEGAVHPICIDCARGGVEVLVLRVQRWAWRSPQPAPCCRSGA